MQLYINLQIWDTHDHLQSEIQMACDRTDKPVAALLKDLKARGLFDDVLVIWGGEIRPAADRPASRWRRSRDLRPRPQQERVLLLDGRAGIKAGTVHGTTDEIGLMAVENKVSVTDWHATILHLLGTELRGHLLRTKWLEREVDRSGARQHRQ